jgi:pectin methylesterase-like acyl-CoA thioesterase
MLAPSALAAKPCVNPGGTQGCSSSIQRAINVASSGATISVAPGVYKEHLLVKKPVRLVGTGPGRSIIDASGSGIHPGVTIQGVHTVTVIRGFTIEKAPLRNPGTECVTRRDLSKHREG